MTTVRIFVSYSHEDGCWLREDSLIPWLARSLRKDAEIWYDRDGLHPGVEFRKRIEDEIDRSDIAILLVSQGFLNSEFIEEVELPRIIARVDRNEMLAVPILVEPCSWEENEFLSARQMMPGKPTPLINYVESPAQWANVRAEILAGIKKTIRMSGGAVAGIPLPAPKPKAERKKAERKDDQYSSEHIANALANIDAKWAIVIARNYPGGGQGNTVVQDGNSSRVFGELKRFVSESSLVTQLLPYLENSNPLLRWKAMRLLGYCGFGDVDRLRSFWLKESNEVVRELIVDLAENLAPQTRLALLQDVAATDDAEYIRAKASQRLSTGPKQIYRPANEAIPFAAGDHEKLPAPLAGLGGTESLKAAGQEQELHSVTTALPEPALQDAAGTQASTSEARNIRSLDVVTGVVPAASVNPQADIPSQAKTPRTPRGENDAVVSKQFPGEAVAEGLAPDTAHASQATTPPDRSKVGEGVGPAASVTDIDGLIARMPEGLRPIGKCLKDQVAAVRRTAVDGLVMAADKTVEPALVHALHDKDDGVRCAALSGLRKLAPEEIAENLLLMLNDQDEEARAWACANLDIQNSGALAAAIEKCSTDRSAKVRAAAASTLSQAKEETAVSVLVAFLSDADDTVRERAARGLASSGDPSALAALANFIPQAPIKSNRTWGMSGSPADSAREAAMDGLRQRAPQQADAALRSALQAADEKLRAWACSYVGKRKDGEDASLLTSPLSDPSALVRGATAWALWERGRPTEASAAATLQKLLHDPDSSVRVAALYAWPRAAGERRRSAVPKVIRLLRDESEDVREHAADALGDIGDAGVVPVLIGRVADDRSDYKPFGNAMWGYVGTDDKPKSAALRALQKLAPDRTLEALQKALKSKTDNVRTWACDRLAFEKGSQALDVLLAAARDPSPKVREAVAKALGVRDDPAGRDAAATLMEDSSPEVKRAAIEAYGRLNRARTPSPGTKG